jgi:hypothetical protein
MMMSKGLNINFEVVEIYSAVIITLIALLLFTGCKSTAKRVDEHNAFEAVRTMELRDTTNPVLLASTSAMHVREYLELGLTHRGYTICHDCQSDAVATVTVHEYSTKQDSTRDFLTGIKNYIVISKSDWTLTIVHNGKTIFHEQINDDESMPIDQLAGKQVQDVLEEIPAHK